MSQRQGVLAAREAEIDRQAVLGDVADALAGGGEHVHVQLELLHHSTMNPLPQCGQVTCVVLHAGDTEPPQLYSVTYDSDEEARAEADQSNRADARRRAHAQVPRAAPGRLFPGPRANLEPRHGRGQGALRRVVLAAEVLWGCLAGPGLGARRHTARCAFFSYVGGTAGCDRSGASGDGAAGTGACP